MKSNYKTFLLVGLFGITCFTLGAFVNKSEDKITIAMIKQAEQLFGLDFSDHEMQLMLGNLEQYKSNYADLRRLNIPNNVSPSINFNPVPAGYIFPDVVNSFKLSKTRPVKLPENRDELAFYTIRQLAALLRTKQISSVELTKFFIERLKKYNDPLLFVTTITMERAMRDAQKADNEIKAGKYRGELHGIPFGVKDLLATKDYKTTYGSVAYKDQVLNYDATVVTRLEAAGGVLVAKLSLGELAQGDVWYGGKTKNPWDIRRGSSGSSAGPASAVASGCLPFAIGSETLGSIISPSTECGTTGLRPSYGRVPKYGAMALSWTMDKLGPLTRTVEDAAIVFNAIKGPDGKDLSAIAAPFNFDETKTIKGLKIGYVKGDFDKDYANKTTDEATLNKLKELGATLIPIELPKLPTSAMLVMLRAESCAAFEELTLSNRDDLLVNQDKDSWPNTFRSSQFIPAVEYIQASRARTMLIEQMAQKLKSLDLYITPTYAKNYVLSNLSGHPCVVLPNGFNKDGLPVSITFMGNLFGESKLLQAAIAYQKATDFHLKHPSLNFYH